MCDNIGEFKLCTCSDKTDKKKPYWEVDKVQPHLRIIDLNKS